MNKFKLHKKNDARIIIGVDDYTFTLKNSCVIEPHLATTAVFSFKLKGDFMTAAITDSIAHTIDYDALTLHIKSLLIHESCLGIAQGIEPIRSKIRIYSPLISGGCFVLTTMCHDTLRYEIDLV